MKVDINDEYRISSDSYNIILSRKTYIKSGKTKGKEEITCIGFYSELKYALIALVKYDLRAKNLEGLKAINDRLDELEKIIKKLCEEGLGHCDCIKIKK